MSEMIMVNRHKAEVLKVYYAVFTTIMDAWIAGELNDYDAQDKLIKLSQRLKAEVTDFGTWN
jgi:hypothetical protein